MKDESVLKTSEEGLAGGDYKTGQWRIYVDSLLMVIIHSRTRGE